jgi:hypothetical protein
VRGAPDFAGLRGGLFAVFFAVFFAGLSPDSPVGRSALVESSDVSVMDAP